MSVILFSELIISASIYYSTSISILFIIETLLIAACQSGTFVLLIPTFHKTFGPKNGASIYGITGILVGLAALLGPILTQQFKGEQTDYLKVYLIGSAAVSFNLIILILFRETAYMYKSQKSNILLSDVYIVASVLSDVYVKDITKIKSKGIENELNENVLNDV
jgi:hypothetical protein